MAQSVKYLPCQPEDLSTTSQNLSTKKKKKKKKKKNPGVFVIPALKKWRQWRQGESLELLGSQPS
jgi:hypothetical protein